MATTAAQVQGASGVAVSSNRIIGLMGIIGVMIFLVGIFGLGGDAPGVGDPVSEGRDWWASNGQTYAVSDYVGMISMILLIFPFVIGMCGILSRAEGREALGSRIALGGFLVFIAVMIASDVSTGPLALGSKQIESDGTFRALQYMEFYTFATAPVAIALFLGGAAYAIVKTKVMWRWLAWFGAALAVAGAVGGAAIIDGDPEGPLAAVGLITIAGALLWMLAASINVFVSKPADSH